MNIHFVKEFPWGEPSHFIEKIWAGFALNDSIPESKVIECEQFKEKWPYSEEGDGPDGWWTPFMKSEPKIHTIREDKNNRWKEGVNIHFQQWIGKPRFSKCYHFAPIIPCVSVQDIKIISAEKRVIVDGRELLPSEIETLAVNDGFSSLKDFFKWFTEDFSGKIIHWTDYRY